MKLLVLVAIQLYTFRCVIAAGVDTCDTIYLLNVVPWPNSEYPGWSRGPEIAPAGQLAAEQINNRTDLLNGYKLEVINIEAEPCSRRRLLFEGYTGIFREMNSSIGDCIFGVTGLFCSSVTEFIAPVLSHENFGYVQLAASTTPSHRNVTMYPYLFHFVSSSEVFNKAMVAMTEGLNWTIVNSVYSPEILLFQTSAERFLNLSKEEGLKVMDFPIAYETVKDEVPYLFRKFNESRVVYFTASEKTIASVLCRAHMEKRVWPTYIYIIHGHELQDIINESDDDDIKCTSTDMEMALEGAFFSNYDLKVDDHKTLYSGMSYSEYWEALNLSDNGTLFANPLYDQVWAFALAMNYSLDRIGALHKTQIQDTPNIREILTEEFLDVDFQGASGRINFKNQSREVKTSANIFQVQNGSLIQVGVFNVYNNTFQRSSASLLLPILPATFDVKSYMIPKVLGSFVLICQAVLIILIVFNAIALIYLRDRPEVKSTSIKVSMVISLGCILMSAGPIISTVLVMADIKNPQVSSGLCYLEVWLSIGGIGIIFAALLFRLARVFHVFRSFRSTGKFWSDTYVLLYIALASLVTMILLIIYTTADQEYKIDKQFKFTLSPYIEKQSHCLSLWIILIYAWIGAMLVTVSVLAFLTRHIKRKHFKDTKKITIYAFSVCVTFVFLITLSYILRLVGITIAAYICSWLAYFCMSLFSQLFLFMPKIIPAILSPKEAKKRYNISSGVSMITNGTSFKKQQSVKLIKF